LLVINSCLQCNLLAAWWESTGFGLQNAAGDGAAHGGERAPGSDRAGVSPWGSDAAGPTPLLFQTRPYCFPLPSPNLHLSHRRRRRLPASQASARPCPPQIASLAGGHSHGSRWMAPRRAAAATGAQQPAAIRRAAMAAQRRAAPHTATHGTEASGSPQLHAACSGCLPAILCLLVASTAC